jgi:predicted metal-dependent phosphoesterase TrpH
MTSRGDFHFHSTFSDGRFSPTWLIDGAAARGARWLALSDHDSTEGLTEAAAACERHDITLIPAVELGTDIPGDEIHMLGYGMQYLDPEFQAFLERMRYGRIGRGREIVEMLNGLGAEVSFLRVQEIAGEAPIGRPHIALALVEAGHVASVQEAFDKYLANDGPAYKKRDQVSPVEAVKLLRKHGGVPVLAHPSFVKGLLDVLPELKAAGLGGMEVYYKDYSGEQIEAFLALCNQHDLFPLGGSDFHGLNNPGERHVCDIPLPDHAIERFVQVLESEAAVPAVVAAA